MIDGRVHVVCIALLATLTSMTLSEWVMIGEFEKFGRLKMHGKRKHWQRIDECHLIDVTRDV